MCPVPRDGFDAITDLFSVARYNPSSDQWIMKSGSTTVSADHVLF